MKRAVFAVVFGSIVAVFGCSSAPPEEPKEKTPGTTSESLCTLSCTACVADPASPYGGVQTCFLCNDDYQRWCRLPRVQCGGILCGVGQTCCGVTCVPGGTIC